MTIFYCQSCGKQGTLPITTGCECGGVFFATFKAARQSKPSKVASSTLKRRLRQRHLHLVKDVEDSPPAA